MSVNRSKIIQQNVIHTVQRGCKPFLLKEPWVASYSEYKWRRYSMGAASISANWPECSVRSISGKDAFISGLRWIWWQSSEIAIIISRGLHSAAQTLQNKTGGNILTRGAYFLIDTQFYHQYSPTFTETQWCCCMSYGVP